MSDRAKEASSRLDEARDLYQEEIEELQNRIDDLEGDVRSGFGSITAVGNLVGRGSAEVRGSGSIAGVYILHGVGVRPIAPARGHGAVVATAFLSGVGATPEEEEETAEWWEFDPSGPHPDDPAMQLEHQAIIYTVVPEDEATHVMVRSGNWSDPGTWDSGVPGDHARVIVPAGMTLTMDADTDRLHWIRIEGVLIHMMDRDINVQVETVVGLPGSEHRIDRSAHKVRYTFLDRGPIEDELRLGRGMILHGRVRWFGQETDTYRLADVHPRAGDSSITLDREPTNWQPGRWIVVPDVTGDIPRRGTVDRENQNNEAREIESIEGTIVHLTEPLEHDHDVSVWAPDEWGVRIPIGYWDATVRFESEAEELGRRAHIMLMHSHDVEIEDVLLVNLGRTDAWRVHTVPAVDEDGEPIPETVENPIGRYALHAHITGDDKDKQQVWRRVIAINDDSGSKWGFVNHSSNVLMDECFAFGFTGAGFSMEAGNEIGTLRKCVSMASYGVDRFESTSSSDERRAANDAGFSGTAFWQLGSGAMHDRCIGMASRHGFMHLARAAAFGVRFKAENLPDPSWADGEDTVPVSHVPVTLFRGNLAIGNHRGFDYIRHGTVIADNVIEDFTSINGTGLVLNYTSNVLIIRLRQRGRGTAVLSNSNGAVSRNYQYIECDIPNSRIWLQTERPGVQVVRSEVGQIEFRARSKGIMSRIEDTKITNPEAIKVRLWSGRENDGSDQVIVVRDGVETLLELPMSEDEEWIYSQEGDLLERRAR